MPLCLPRQFPSTNSSLLYSGIHYPDVELLLNFNLTVRAGRVGKNGSGLGEPKTLVDNRETLVWAAFLSRRESGARNPAKAAEDRSAASPVIAPIEMPPNGTCDSLLVSEGIQEAFVHRQKLVQPGKFSSP
jgi:hypothetical protein